MGMTGVREGSRLEGVMMTDTGVGTMGRAVEVGVTVGEIFGCFVL
jgi:hypothetical protein